MGLNFFEKIKLRLKFFKFFKRVSFLKIPFDLNSFEKIIVFLPEDSDSFYVILNKIKVKFEKKIEIFFPKDINYRNLERLNKEIIKNKTLIIDFLEKNEFKNFIVFPSLWVSKEEGGNLVIKTEPEGIFSFILENG